MCVYACVLWWIGELSVDSAGDCWDKLQHPQLDSRSIQKAVMQS